MKENNFLTFLLISSISSILLIILLCFLQISTYSLPKVIWQFWDKEEPPPIIRMIKENNMKKLTGWKFNYLNEKTIGQYISPFDYPTNYDELSPAHKADWIRVFLLKTYGGVWMDASIIINDPKAIDALYDAGASEDYLARLRLGLMNMIRRFVWDLYITRKNYGKKELIQLAEEKRTR